MPACPGCGTALDGIGPQTRVLACPGCGHRVHAGADRGADGGRPDGVLGAPTYLAVDRVLRIDGRAFRIGGRVRLEREGGHRDDWWLVPSEGDGRWLEESEGRYLLHRTVEHPIPPEALSGITVGRRIDAGGTSLLVTASYAAEVLGTEGELPRAFERGVRTRRLEAIGGGWRVSLDLHPDGVAASVAEPLAGERFALDPR